MTSLWHKVRKLLVNDSLSIALFALFLICLAGQGLSGWLAYNASLAAARMGSITLGEYFQTGTFLDGLFSNWQAAILQLAILVTFSAVLRQKGAAHSRKTPAVNHRRLTWTIAPRSNVIKWLMANSLSLAFIAIFIVTFGLHGVFGEWKYNEEQIFRQLPEISLSGYLRSSSFWFSSFQCWEAEFGAIGLFVVFSIFLRQEGSPESKPPEASNEQTGGVNE